MKIGAFTDKGKKREINEDCFYVSDFNDKFDGEFCIIADGMGGHNSGDIASRTAVDVVKNYIEENYKSGMTSDEIVKLLTKSMSLANDAIYKKAISHQEHEGMGTTAIVCVLGSERMHIAHVGDSRAYIVRDDVMEQITTDHSVVEELIVNGTITREEAGSHPQKHVITRALGSEERTQIDVYIQKYKKDDIIFICTDGLTNMLSDAEILSTLKNNDSLQGAVVELIKLANDRGGPDNITAVAIRL